MCRTGTWYHKRSNYNLEPDIGTIQNRKLAIIIEGPDQARPGPLTDWVFLNLTAITGVVTYPSSDGCIGSSTGRGEWSLVRGDTSPQYFWNLTLRLFPRSHRAVTKPLTPRQIIYSQGSWISSVEMPILTLNARLHTEPDVSPADVLFYKTVILCEFSTDYFVWKNAFLPMLEAFFTV